MKVWTNHTDTVVAKSIADVKAVLADCYGKDNDFDEEEWSEIEGSHPITIMTDHGDPPSVTKTAAEWALSDGRGLLCSTEY